LPGAKAASELRAQPVQADFAETLRGHGYVNGFATEWLRGDGSIRVRLSVLEFDDEQDALNFAGLGASEIPEGMTGDSLPDLDAGRITTATSVAEQLSSRAVALFGDGSRMFSVVVDSDDAAEATKLARSLAEQQGVRSS
jgi:hypothetical protein